MPLDTQANDFNRGILKEDSKIIAYRPSTLAIQN
jgi:hypothetical protein